MCKECGCGTKSGAKPAQPDYFALPSIHQNHPHPHVADYTRESVGAATAVINKSLLDKNDQLAASNRQLFHEKKLLVLNVLSSPGSGKTTLIQETARKLAGTLRLGVVVGDLATENDATRLRAAGVPVVQVTTGTVCHLEAAMVAKAVKQLDLAQLDLLIIENVGNLVCPADFDLGEDLRVVLLSTTEGEDKPLKYPPVFHSASAAIITKIDMAEPAGFDREKALSNLRRVCHHAQVFELSSKTGAGMNAWCEFLRQTHLLERKR